MASSAATISPAALRALIQAELPGLVAIRHDLHAHPELGYQEHRTSSIVRGELERAGIALAGGMAGGTGVLGHLPGEGTRAIGLRADMDALPIEETTGLEYASTVPGTMHACGHDGHTTILLGVARVLARLARQAPLPRPVTLVFQPAEEGGAGAKRMIEDGCLDGSVLGPPVDHMFGLHGWPRLPVGTVATRPGPLLAAADTFQIQVSGVGSHAAFPHVGRDPIVAASAIVGALQTIAARSTDPLDSAVVSVTMFHAGSATNVIPGEVHLAGTARSLVPAVQDLIQRRLHELAVHVARAHGCQARVEYHMGYPVTRNDPGAVEIFGRTAREALSAERVLTVERPVMGGEDFAFYSQVVPSCFFILGLIPPGAPRIPELHQSDFDFIDDAIATGIEVFCRLALRLPP
jgi:amidohydrolase